jgi:hypothetical protein
MQFLQRLAERLIFPLALVAGVLGLVYWYWTTTPAYAINSIIDAVRHHDKQTFEKYVDIDQLASHAFDDIVEGPAREQLLPRMDNMIGVGFLRFFKGEIVGVAHDKLCGFISDPSIQLQAGGIDGSLAAMQKYKITPRVRQTLIDYGMSPYGFKGIKYLETKGSNSYLGLEFTSPRVRGNYIVEFRLEDAGGYWRVAELTNLNDLVSLYLSTRNPSDPTRF